MVMSVREGQKGFTLIELMIVVAIIGILAMIAIPRFVQLVERTRMAKAASELTTIVKAFELYAIENQGVNRGYPNDTNLVLPAGMEDYLDNELFTSETPLGGVYNWDGPDFYVYAGLAIQNVPEGDAIMIQLDEKIDDGNLSTGVFQKTPNSRYTYLLWVK